MTPINKPFKILSIDGGGIKGLFSATVLAHLEKVYGRSCGEAFDMICGTSTGGLIALGIASGKPVQDIADLYAKHGGEIFPASKHRLLRSLQRKVVHRFRQVAWNGKYDNAVLKHHLGRIFGEAKLGELQNLVCIPTYSLLDGRPWVLKYPHAEGGFYREKDIRIVDAALSTSAAPTYLPIHAYDKGLFVDGGLWANNPALVGLTEALSYFVGEGKDYDSVEILSVASVSNPSGWVPTSKVRRGFAGWTSKLIEIPMQGQAYFTDFFLKQAMTKMMPNLTYKRIECGPLSAAQMALIDMDHADEQALFALGQLGESKGLEVAKDDQIKRFFETNKSYQTEVRL